MENKWAVVIGEKERIELEAIVVDENKEAALKFLKKVILAQIVASEQGKLKNPGFSKGAVASYAQKRRSS